LEASPREFLRHPRYGVVHLVTFYNLWIDLARQLGQLRPISYEAMRADPVQELGGLLEWMGLSVDSELLAQTVVAGSLPNMRQLSVSPAYAGTAIAARDVREPRSAKVRQGSSQGFRQLFDSDDMDYVQRVIADLFMGVDDPAYANLIRIPEANVSLLPEHSAEQIRSAGR
jgi:hypothetical protein